MKKALALFLAAILLISAVPFSARAEEGAYSDIDGHWGEEAILKMTELGIVAGYPDGTFKPDNCITKAEVCVMLERVMENYG